MVDVLMTFNVYSSNVTDFLLIEFDYDILDYLNFNIVSVPSQNDNITVFYGVNFVKQRSINSFKSILLNITSFLRNKQAEIVISDTSSLVVAYDVCLIILHKRLFT